MDKLSAMAVFVAIVDRGSLTGAAETLGKSQPAVVRTLARLETELGVRLLRRTTRTMTLTDAGRDYLRRCRRILADVAEAEAEASGTEAEPAGTLRITAPVTFGQRHVAPAVAAFLKQHNRIRIELSLLDRVVNLLDEGLDLSVRIGALAASGLVARPVGTMRRVVVASPALLAKHGVPGHPRELTKKPCVRFRQDQPLWHFQEQGKTLAVPIDGPLVSNQAAVAVDACAAGLGFGQFLAYQPAPALADGQLQLVLEAFEPEPLPVHLVYADARMMPLRLRVFVDFARDRLQQELLSLAEAG